MNYLIVSDVDAARAKLLALGAAVGEVAGVLGRGLDPVEQRVDGDAPPDGVELRAFVTQ